MVAERTGPHAPVKLSGSIPPLAEAFHQRPETGLDLRVGQAVLADSERYLGPDHPLTRAMRDNLEAATRA